MHTKNRGLHNDFYALLYSTSTAHSFYGGSPTTLVNIQGQMNSNTLFNPVTVSRSCISHEAWTIIERWRTAILEGSGIYDISSFCFVCVVRTGIPLTLGRKESSFEAKMGCPISPVYRTKVAIPNKSVSAEVVLTSGRDGTYYGKQIQYQGTLKRNRLKESERAQNSRKQIFRGRFFQKDFLPKSCL